MTDEEKKEIENYAEYALYFMIDGFGSYIWRTNHDIHHDRYPMTPEIEESLKKVSEIQQLCLQQLSKFGVDPESAKDRANGDYWKWYTFWDNWKKDMSDKEWRKLEKKMSQKEDVSDLLPKRKWNEN
jgi:hypothetical protein